MAMDPAWFVCSKCDKKPPEMTHFHYPPSGVLCDPCYLEWQAVLGKSVPKEPVEEFSGYWIYPGELRPVVVLAETRPAAEKLVMESPEYDGFFGVVYRVEEFERLCREGKAP